MYQGQKVGCSPLRIKDAMKGTGGGFHCWYISHVITNTKGYSNHKEGFPAM